MRNFFIRRFTIGANDWNTTVKYSLIAGGCIGLLAGFLVLLRIL